MTNEQSRPAKQLSRLGCRLPMEFLLGHPCHGTGKVAVALLRIQDPGICTLPLLATPSSMTVLEGCALPIFCAGVLQIMVLRCVQSQLQQRCEWYVGGNEFLAVFVALHVECEPCCFELVVQCILHAAP